MFNFITDLKTHKKLVKKACDGWKCNKHGRYGSPHAKFVCLSQKLDVIHWRDIQKETRKQAPISDFVEVAKGITTKVLQRIAKKDQQQKEDCVLSLIGQKRTLDFEFKSKEERDEWFSVLQAVFDQVKLGIPKKFKEDGVNEEDIQKCENALKKFAFDIDSSTWKISKALTRSAKFTDEEFSCLGACLEPNHLLRIIDLQENNVSDSQLSCLCDNLNRAVNLTQLNLSGNAISNDGILHLSKALKTNKSIKILDLKSNTITDAGANSLAAAISVNKTIEEVYLDKNSIADEGASSLAGSLHQHESMRILSINDNNIGNEGAQDLATAFKNSKKLQIVRLARNQIMFHEKPNDDEDDGTLEVNLFLAVDGANYAEMVLLLLQGADPNVQNEEDGRTPLHVAGMRGNLDILDFLIDHPQMDLNIQDDAEMTPLTLAMSSKQPDVVKILLEKGADINVGDKNKKTVLHYASEQGDKVIVKLLVENYNDDILRTTVSDQTPLHFAAQNLHKAIVEYLLQREEQEKKENKRAKPDNDEEYVPYVNYQDSLGETALHKVFSGNGKVDIDIAKLLIQKGADVSTEDNQQKTALDYCDAQSKEVLLNESRRRMAAK